MNNKRKWYLENKEFLRAFESTKVFKDYRNIRLKKQKLQNRLKYLEKVLNQIQNPKNKNYLFFYYFEIRKRKNQIKLLDLEQKNSLKRVQEERLRHENKFLKKKLNNGGKTRKEYTNNQ